MTENAVSTVDKSIIDGSQVVHREMARLFVPSSKNEDGLSSTYGVDKCVLKDGRTVFQCVHPEGLDCTYWNVNGISVRSHLRVHSPVLQAKRLRAERDELLAERETRARNYQAGAIKAAATREANRLARKNGTEDQDGTTGMSATEYNRKLGIAANALEGAADGLAKVVTILGNIRLTLDTQTAALDELAEQKPEAVDPALKDKAARWDAFQDLMEGKRNK